MKNLLILVFTFITFGAMAQTPASAVITGTTDVQKLNDEKAYPWFATGCKDYTPDAATLKTLKENMPADATLLVFAGTWCSDTQYLLPKFYKTLDDAGISRDRVKLYLLDEQKQSPEQLEKQYQVVSVPTFIVLQNGKELGRIVETVQKSIEADLVNKLQKK